MSIQRYILCILKSIVVLVPWPSTKYTIRGKVVASPKYRRWWVMWVYVCMWLTRAPKCSNYALTNLFGLCRSMWVIELLVNHPSPIRSSNMPFYPQSATNCGAHPNSFSFRCSPLDSELSPSRSLGVRHVMQLEIWPTQEIIAKMCKCRCKWQIIACSYKYGGYVLANSY